VEVVENPKKGGRATAPSIIKKIQEVHGREEAPHDGGPILPEDIQMEPFNLKALTILS
jgi:hypothetical protein